MIKLLFIKFALIFLILTSCETVSNLTDSSSDKDNQLLSDELGSDPTLEEILAEAEMNFEDTSSEELNFESEDQLEVAEEILPPNPTTEYDTTLIDSNESSDLAQEKSNKEIIEPITSQDIQSFDKTYERSKLDLDEQIQYRVATINFSSGSSSVNNAGLKKIKKIAKIAKERNAKIKVIGHASERTKDMPIAEHKLVNFIISDKRANSVAEIFIKKYNFPSDKLITQGVSDSKPLFKEIMPAGTTANQGTEIFLIY